MLMLLPRRYWWWLLAIAVALLILSLTVPQWVPWVVLVGVAAILQQLYRPKI